MPDILIMGTAYVDTPEKAATFGLWRDLVVRLNSGVDVLVVDTPGAYPLPTNNPSNFSLIAFSHNLGHLSVTARDGWGRAFTAGLRHAIDGGYEWVVNIETDLLFVHPVAPVIAKMKRSGVKIAAPMAYPWPFTETGLCFIHVPTMKEIGFIEKYDWERAPSHPLPEQRFDAITSEYLFALPLRGCRDDTRRLTPHNLSLAYPCGIDWLTHAAPDTMRAMARLGTNV